MPLDLPAPDPAQLARSPLELVVCQIRFDSPAIPRDGSVALALHDALGADAGPYPRMEQLNTMTIGIPLPQPAGLTPGWRFASADGTWTVSVMPDNVALETRSYTTWGSDFCDRLALLIDVIADVLKPSIEQRIGLRYVDRIGEFKLAKLRDWKPYIGKEFLGLALHSKLGRHVETSQQVLTLALDSDISCVLRHGSVADEATRDKLDYLLDFDVFRQGGRPFDREGLKAVADQLNTYALQLFHAAVTPKLLEELRVA